MIDSEDIKKIIGEVVVGFDNSSLEDEMNFSEAGIDSLDQANILLEIEERHDVKIPDEAVSRCSSIRGIIEFFNEKKSS